MLPLSTSTTNTATPTWLDTLPIPNRGPNTYQPGIAFHFHDCGCLGSEPSQAASYVDKIVQQAASAYRSGVLQACRPLLVAYIIPHHNVTGGLKVLLTHLKMLRKQGHYCVAVYRRPSGSKSPEPSLPAPRAGPEGDHMAARAGNDEGSCPDEGMTSVADPGEVGVESQEGRVSPKPRLGALPAWAVADGAVADEEVVLSPSQHLMEAYPVERLDVVVAGMFHNSTLSTLSTLLTLSSTLLPTLSTLSTLSTLLTLSSTLSPCQFIPNPRSTLLTLSSTLLPTLSTLFTLSSTLSTLFTLSTL
eukprot:gene20031-26748_t